MRTTQQLSITLPNDMADVVKTKVKTGEYASESEVIRDGLRALLARDRAVESCRIHFRNRRRKNYIRTSGLTASKIGFKRPRVRV